MIDLAKNFATTVSPWVVTMDALEPFRVAPAPRPAGDPVPLPYLTGDADRLRGAFDGSLDVFVASARMRDAGLRPHRLSTSNLQDLYWTLPHLATPEQAERWSDLLPLLTWQLWLARPLVNDVRWPW